MIANYWYLKNQSLFPNVFSLTDNLCSITPAQKYQVSLIGVVKFFKVLAWSGKKAYTHFML